MKRVLFVIPRLGIGGVERSLLSLLEAMPQDGYTVSVLVFSSGGELEGALPAGVTLLTDRRMGSMDRLRKTVSSAVKRLGSSRLFALLKALYHRIGAATARETVNAEEYDIAVAYADGMSTWYVAQSIKAKQKYAFVHTDFIQAAYSATQEQEIYRCYDGVFASSVAAKERFLEVVPMLRERTNVIYSVVDADRLRVLSQQAGELPTLPTEDILIATVGRLSWEKGVEKIPPLLSKLKQDGIQAHWCLAGDGPEREKLRNECRRLGVSDMLVLLGNVQNPYPLFAACDIYVQPSTYEGYCIALAEAKVFCKPIIACDFSGAREQLEDSVTGFIVGMGVDEIYAKLKRLALEPELRGELSQGLRQEDRRPADTRGSWWSMLCVAD